MLSRNQALRELNNKPKQYFLTYYRFMPLCCRWGKKKKEGRESKKPWWANIPPRLSHALLTSASPTPAAAQHGRHSCGQAASGTKGEQGDYLQIWDCVRKASLYCSISHQSTFLQWEPTTFYSRRANIFHRTCAHVCCCQDLEMFSLECTWILRTSRPRQSHTQQCNWSSPSTKNDTGCGNVVWDFWKITDFKLPTT